MVVISNVDLTSAGRVETLLLLFQVRPLWSALRVLIIACNRVDFGHGRVTTFPPPPERK